MRPSDSPRPDRSGLCSPAALQELQAVLNYTFGNTDLLQQALVHSSYYNEHPDFPLGHNERLEYLGDAVLELIVTDHLFYHCPKREGDLTNWRSSLVNANNLAGVARRINLGRWIMASRDAAGHAWAQHNTNVLADAVEAVIGALYLDGGLPAAEPFVARYILVNLPDVREQRPALDPKSRFQDMCQKAFKVVPKYRVLGESGTDHRKTFIVGVFLGPAEVARGQGSSKKIAEINAAINGLKTKGW